MTGTAGQDSGGYGQLDSFVYGSEFNKIAFAVKQMIARLDTMKLVKVTAVTGGGGAIAAAGTVNVQPLVNLLDGKGNASTPALVSGIPWWRYGGKNGAVICDPAVGDIGYVVCADRDISNVITTKAQANPGSYRRYNIADGIYIGSLLGSAPQQYLTFTSTGLSIVDLNGNKIEFIATGIKFTAANGDVLDLTASGFALNGNLAVTGTITATGNITAGLGTGDLVTLQLHQHTANNTPPTPGI